MNIKLVVCFLISLSLLGSLTVQSKELQEKLGKLNAIEQVLISNASYSNRIRPNFTWSMPNKRYGLDNNHNGIYDLPNSIEYVNNIVNCPMLGDRPQFKVKLNATTTRFPSLAGRHISENYSPQNEYDLGDTNLIPPRDNPIPPRDIIQNGLEKIKANYNVMRISKRKIYWIIDGISKEDNSYKYEVCLPEGEHTIKLKAVDEYTNEWNIISKKITVEDFLIVVIGDSYGSGEGNPELHIKATYEVIRPEIPSEWVRKKTDNYEARDYEEYLDELVADYLRKLVKQYKGKLEGNKIKFAIWADDGQQPPVKEVRHHINVRISPYFDTGEKEKSTTQRTLTVIVHGMPDFNAYTETAKAHDKSHRSSFSASSQLALSLENNSEKYSVTYINLAMSGATIDKGVRTKYLGNKRSRFYNKRKILNSQIETLTGYIKGGKNTDGLTKNRTVDALIISIGGNDIGFGNAAVALILHDGNLWLQNKVTYRNIKKGVNSGAWQDVENTTGFFESHLSWTELIGLDNLQSSFDGLATTLRDLKKSSSLNIKDIYITEYPDFTAKFKKGKLYWCAEILDEINLRLFSFIVDTEIRATELEWAYDNILIPLNNKIYNAAYDNNWIYIDGIRSITDGHGLCAKRPSDPFKYNENVTHNNLFESNLENSFRWFRNALDSRIINADGDLKNTPGTLHPNEFGHLAIKERLLNKVKHPNY